LPDLGNNIKCGNSLIGPDFYEQLGQSSLFADEEMVHRINTFDWKDKQHGFGEIMTAGGFDAVIGNPPYIFTREQLTDAERSYFAERYEASWEKHNTYMLFAEARVSGLEC
jgi:tRNA1(Val) A37 N6-methylase TrmN6